MPPNQSQQNKPRRQWTLRSTFFVITGIGFLLAGATTFGIAVSLTSLIILGVGGFVYVRTRMNPQRNRTLPLASVVSMTLAVLYVATFISFRVFRTFEFSLAPPDEPQHNIVVFSVNPSAQDLARLAYYPLIKYLPGNCVYLTGEQMNLLNHGPFAGEPITLYW